VLNRIQLAFDVSGLAWRYRTGVQNLYWAFLAAWSNQEKFHENFDISFYDRSGIYNSQIVDMVGAAYNPCARAWWPDKLRRPLQLLLRKSDFLAPKLGNRINHVWNWDIFNPEGCRGSITIPDLLPLEYPQWFDKKFIYLTERSLRFAADEAEFIFVISEDVKQRVEKISGIPAERIRVVYPGIDQDYFIPINKDFANSVLRKHGLESGCYLLSSGFLDPRKNLARQLAAFNLVLSRGEKGIKYALTGLRTSLSEDLIRLIDSPVMRENVIFLGYVPKDELIALTSHSSAMMYCSLAEGFGLPIIEAMALGTPVITSACTSMQELAASKAAMVDPFDIEEMADAIQDVMGWSDGKKAVQGDINKTFASQFTIQNWLGGHLDIFSGKDESNRWL